MMLRLASALVIVAQLVVIALYLRPTGGRAILFTFVGTPLVAAGVLLAIVWVLRIFGRIRRANVDPGNRSDPASRIAR
jgi:hypothetical protein